MANSKVKSEKSTEPLEDEGELDDAAAEDTAPTPEELEDGWVEPEVVDDDETVAVEDEDAVDDADVADGDDDVDDDEKSHGAGDKALDELEAEELDMLTDDEASETLVIDEAAEILAIRRAELSLSGDEVGEARSDEFVCTSCFLVKKSSQLSDKRKKICLDCAA